MKHLSKLDAGLGVCGQQGLGGVAAGNDIQVKNQSSPVWNTLQIRVHKRRIAIRRLAPEFGGVFNLQA